MVVEIKGYNLQALVSVYDSSVELQITALPLEEIHSNEGDDLVTRLKVPSSIREAWAMNLAGYLKSSDRTLIQFLRAQVDRRESNK